jgi:hypothetical protein
VSFLRARPFSHPATAQCAHHDYREWSCLTTRQLARPFAGLLKALDLLVAGWRLHTKPLVSETPDRDVTDRREGSGGIGLPCLRLAVHVGGD